MQNKIKYIGKAPWSTRKQLSIEVKPSKRQRAVQEFSKENKIGQSLQDSRKEEKPATMRRDEHYEITIQNLAKTLPTYHDLLTP